MISNITISLDDIKQKVSNRPVYIWGARHDGLGIYCALKRNNVPIEGFLDSNAMLAGKKVLGLSIQTPIYFFQNRQPSISPFIFIASSYFADEIVEECQSYGLKHNKDFLTTQELQNFNYQIDHSGACNLHCISCARGNLHHHPPVGYTSAATYKKVIQKILRDDPFTGVLRLYDWGEPLLNPDLPEIVRITNEHNVLSIISSNLCINKNLEEVVKARPTWFRVSISGWEENYEITHTGGKWDTLYRNMHQLSVFREKHYPEMEVEVFFHIYNHNQDDFDRICELCEKLDFIPRYTHAYLFPMDSVEAVIDGKPLNPAIRRTRELMLLSVEEAMEYARQQKDRICYFERFLRITWDLKVTSCINWYNPDLLLLEKDFLSADIYEIFAARNSCGLCVRCKSKSLHRYCNVYGDQKLVHSRGSLKV